MSAPAIRGEKSRQITEAQNAPEFLCARTRDAVEYLVHAEAPLGQPTF